MTYDGLRCTLHAVQINICSMPIGSHHKETPEQTIRNGQECHKVCDGCRGRVHVFMHILFCLTEPFGTLQNYTCASWQISEKTKSWTDVLMLLNEVNSVSFNSKFMSNDIRKSIWTTVVLPINQTMLFDAVCLFQGLKVLTTTIRHKPKSLFSHPSEGWNEKTDTERHHKQHQ